MTALYEVPVSQNALVTYKYEVLPQCIVILPQGINIAINIATIVILPQCIATVSIN